MVRWIFVGCNNFFRIFYFKMSKLPSTPSMKMKMVMTKWKQEYEFFLFILNCFPIVCNNMRLPFLFIVFRSSAISLLFSGKSTIKKTEMSKGDKYAQKRRVLLFFLSCNLVSPLSHVKKTILGPSDAVGWLEKLNENEFDGGDEEGQSLVFIPVKNWRIHWVGYAM